jgi:hypothetical protein
MIGTTNRNVTLLNTWGSFQPDDPVGAVYDSTRGAIFVFGNTWATTTNVTDGTSTKHRDIWVVRFLISGVVDWMQTFGGARDDVVTDATLDTTTGSLLVTGKSLSDRFPASNWTNIGNYDVFVMRVSSDGQMVDGFSYGSNAEDMVSHIVMDSTNSLSVYLVGTTLGRLFNVTASSFIARCAIRKLTLYRIVL